MSFLDTLEILVGNYESENYINIASKSYNIRNFRKPCQYNEYTPLIVTPTDILDFVLYN